MPDVKIEVLAIPPATTVGECPVWDDRTGRLWWVDIQKPALHRSDPATGHTETWMMPAPVGSLGLCRSGHVLLALQSGLHRFDPATAALEFLIDPEPEAPGNRLNDGKVSPDGRFFIGSMDDGPEPKQECAGLYVYSPDHSCRKLVPGLIIANGLAWSPDGRTMWHSDSRHERIWCWDYDPAGCTISGQREIAAPGEAEGKPDGAAMDIEGGYWSAGVSAGVLNRWLPDGTLDRTIKLPVPAPTMPCFGGPGLRTLYVTSLVRPPGHKLDGSLLALDAGVAGVPVARFAD